VQLNVTRSSIGTPEIHSRSRDLLDRIAPLRCAIVNRTEPRLLAIESPFPAHHSMLRLLEPPHSCRKSLWERLFNGTYDKPFILDTAHLRCLHFDLDAVQSAMHLHDPDRLSLAYTRKMMAFLLFNGSPNRILLLGLGGGSLAKFCYRRLPRAAITVVEVNPHVIALREAFRIPADDDRFRVVRADSANYVAGLGLRKDAILADACDRSGIAPEIDAIEFYQNAWRRLSQGGVFVMNLCGDRSRFESHLAKIRHVFGEFMTLPAGRDSNLIVFAFKEDHTDVSWQHLAASAIELKRRFGLDFPRYVRRIALHWNLRKWHAPPD
jgi:spermidine synthase